MNTRSLSVPLPAQASEKPAPSRSYWSTSLLRFRRDRTSVAAVVVFCFIIIISYGAPWIAENILHTSATEQDILNNFTPWFTPGHLLGTDELGRDTLTRALFAGQVSLAIGFTVAALSMTIGVLLGLVAGFYGGRMDDAINATLQIVNGIPLLFLLIALSVIFRPDPLGLALIFGIFGWTATCRQMRGLTFSIRERDYIDAARVIGVRDRQIMLKHVLPNVSSIILVIAGFDIAGAILAEAGLSYLGLGVQPPTPSWGNMLSSALENITRAPWLVVTPGLFITVTVLCIFLIADGLRDAFDPQMTDRA